MANINKFMQNLLTDVEVKLKQHIQENFRQQSFYGTPWAAKKIPGGKQKLLYSKGILQEQVDPEANHSTNTVQVYSTLPYAAIHNQGGQITVTAKMKAFFWAMYYKTSGAVATKKDGTASKSQRNTTLTQQANHWRAMAMMKVGSKITIPQRQFVGPHPILDAAIEQIADQNVQELAQQLAAILKPK